MARRADFVSVSDSLRVVETSPAAAEKDKEEEAQMTMMSAAKEEEASAPASMALTPRRGNAAALALKERRSPSAGTSMVETSANGDVEAGDADVSPSSSSTAGSPSKAFRTSGSGASLVAKRRIRKLAERCLSRFGCRPLRPFLCRALGIALMGYVALFLRGHTLLEEYHIRFFGYYGQGDVSKSNIPGRTSYGLGGAWRAGRSSDRRRFERELERKAEERRERTRPSRVSLSGKEKVHLKRYGLSLVDDGRRGMPPSRNIGERFQHRRLEEGEVKGDDFSGNHEDADKSEAPPVSNGGEEDDARFEDADAEADNNAVDERKNDEEDNEEESLRLCGRHARAAALSHPSSFHARDALNPSSRVLISGILTPLGMNLALMLHRQCGVKHIMGIDPMFPNTVASRMIFLNRIKALHRELGDALVLPVVLPFVGLDPLLSEKGAARSKQLAKGLRGTWEVDLVKVSSDLGFPTHLVQVAGAYIDSYRDIISFEDGTVNIEHPYVADSAERICPLLKIRSTVCMEHSLMSLKNVNDPERRPHFVYASSEDVHHRRQTTEGKEDDDFHGAVKTIEEVLAAVHGDGAYSVGLRLPRVYGPWGMSGLNPEHDMVEELLTGNVTEALSNMNGAEKSFDDRRGLMLIDDAVDAFIAAMQYRPKGSEPTVFDVSNGGDGSNLSLLGDIIRGHVTGQTTNRATGGKVQLSPSQLRTRSHLGFSLETSLADGATKLLSWHLHSLPAVRTPSATRRDVNPSISGKLRHLPQLEARKRWGEPVFPCASECSSESLSCTKSVIDAAAILTRTLTDGCVVVLYTASLLAAEDAALEGSGVPFEADYRTEEDGESQWPVVCNIAFVRRDGALVKDLMDNLSSEASSEVKTLAGEGKEVGAEQQLDFLNGRLAHRGWILVWVPPGEEERTMEGVMSLLKISPGSIFAPTVKYAIFADGAAEDTPSTYEDVIFIMGMMGRKESVSHVVDRIGNDRREHRLNFPSERRRWASILASEISGSPAKARKSLKDALLQVLKGKKSKNVSPSVVRSVKRQKEMYSSAFSLLNRKELRTAYGPRFHLEYAHWIESSWLAHDLTHPESRLLRCEWLREDLLWGNGMDQITFAHVMAMRDLERRLIRGEADDEMRERMEGKLTEEERTRKAIIESLTDWEEWHPVISGEERQRDDQCGRVSLVEKINRMARTHPSTSMSLTSPIKKGKCQDHFVRIASTHVIQYLRKKWREKKKDFPAKQSGDFKRGERNVFVINK